MRARGGGLDIEQLGSLRQRSLSAHLRALVKSIAARGVTEPPHGARGRAQEQRDRPQWPLWVLVGGVEDAWIQGLPDQFLDHGVGEVELPPPPTLDTNVSVEEIRSTSSRLTPCLEA